MRRRKADTLLPHREQDIVTRAERPAPPICDFCSRPLWDRSFLTAQTTHNTPFDEVAEDGKVYHVVLDSLGGWAACGDCAAYIDAGDHDGLINHVMRICHQPVLPMLRAVLKDFYEESFWPNYPFWEEVPE